MRRLLLVLAAAALAAVLVPSCARAQMGSSAEEQSFDYNPDDGSAPQLEQPVAETTYDDAEMVNHPEYGTIMLSKHRWKNWVSRALYLALVNIAMLAIILSLSRADEHNLVIAYSLSGVSFTISFWVLLCAALLIKLKASAWLYVAPVSLALGAVSYAVLMKIKRTDISLAELKESFKRMHDVAQEDQRLSSVDGSPGDWPDQDFIK